MSGLHKLHRARYERAFKDGGLEAAYRERDSIWAADNSFSHKYMLNGVIGVYALCYTGFLVSTNSPPESTMMSVGLVMLLLGFHVMNFVSFSYGQKTKIGELEGLAFEVEEWRWRSENPAKE